MTTRSLMIVAGFAAVLYATPPAVSNRAPGNGDIGYLPADGATVETNPPALTWLLEPEAQAYAVQFARDAAFRRGAITIPKTPWALYTHTARLSTSRWFWRYACLDAAGRRSAWSVTRSFVIAPNAQPFPRPDEKLIQNRMPRQHPRLMLRPEEVPAFRQARTGAQEKRWNALVTDAERGLKRELIPEPPPWTDGKWNAPEWARNFREATNAI